MYSTLWNWLKYPPAGKESEEEGGSSGGEVDEGIEDSDENEGSTKKSKSKKKKKSTTKKKVRKGNPLLQEASVEVTEECKEDELLPSSEVQTKNEDDLWADFLADTEEKKEPEVKPKPKGKSWAELLGKKKPKASNTLETTGNFSLL